MITPMYIEPGKVYGECISKKFRITPDWKCVDFRMNPKFTPQEQNEIATLLRERDWFDVCQWCRHFTQLTEAKQG